MIIYDHICSFKVLCWLYCRHPYPRPLLAAPLLDEVEMPAKDEVDDLQAVELPQSLASSGIRWRKNHVQAWIQVLEPDLPADLSWLSQLPAKDEVYVPAVELPAKAEVDDLPAVVLPAKDEVDVPAAKLPAQDEVDVPAVELPAKDEVDVPAAELPAKDDKVDVPAEVDGPATSNRHRHFDHT